MFVVIYRWRVRPDMEDVFIEGWERVTRAIYARCASYGSRLHRSDDGTWVGYARWPDEATRARCVHGDQEGCELMASAIVETYEELRCVLVSDLLAEPAPS